MHSHFLPHPHPLPLPPSLPRSLSLCLSLGRAVDAENSQRSQDPPSCPHRSPAALHGQAPQREQGDYFHDQGKRGTPVLGSYGTAVL